jgi:hypothetical protein
MLEHDVVSPDIPFPNCIVQIPWRVQEIVLHCADAKQDINRQIELVDLVSLFCELPLDTARRFPGCCRHKRHPWLFILETGDFRSLGGAEIQPEASLKRD